MHRDPERVAVVIVNYGAAALLERDLAASGIGDDSDVIVVDNFVSTDERSAITRLCEAQSWRLVANERNLGFGRAVDVGVEAADASGHRLVLILNPDAWLSPDAVAGLAAVATSNPGAIVSPVIDRPDGSVWMENTEFLPWRGLARHAPTFSDGRPLQWLTAACLMIEVASWRRLGGFDEDYFLYWEDVDLTYRHARAGGRLLIASGIRAVHSVGGTQTGPASKSSLYMRYNARNRFLFARKNLGAARTVAWVATTPYFLWVLMRAGNATSAAVGLRLFAAALRGCVEGLTVRIR